MSSMYLAFIDWSPHCGMATIGCPSTSNCGLHVTIRPLSLALSVKPTGTFEVSEALTTHRKSLPLL
nr:unnamed protein product [Digitaria exilis]